MKLLAIDTATEACSLALALDDRVLSRHVVAGRDQTAVLLPMFHQLMSEAGIRVADLDAIACGVGPGSFAGVRIGVGFVKGLAFVRDVPIVPVMSLASLAQGALRRTGAARVLSCIDARMGEVYAAVYERGGDGLARAVDPPRVCRPDALKVVIAAPWIAAGTGWGTYREALRPHFTAAPMAEEPSALPEAVDAITLARDALARGESIPVAELEPVYLRNDVALTLEQQAQARRQKAASIRGEIS
ncbi:MAG TPA: tRNA (adenosine(37)-N6)-threonylcarbamoyltransferase complex dimerization subunit type 1 TsaB [Nevskiaceae bacterium]|nr:tRNA (adenosine(37)-N6)-threonylcarbamoyltransferase complex dimerization subunit type 1 TsaB [Nevskiaceae bacterium]